MIMDWFKGVGSSSADNNYDTWWNKLQTFWNGHDNGSLAWSTINANAFQKGGISMSNVVLQVVLKTNTASATITSSTFSDTALTQTITPRSASSTILIFVSGMISTPSSGTGTGLVTISNGSGNLATAQGVAQYRSLGPGTTTGRTGVGFCFANAPGSTSTQTYKVQIANNDGTSTIIWNENGVTASMILVEYL